MQINGLSQNKTDANINSVKQSENNQDNKHLTDNKNIIDENDNQDSKNQLSQKETIKLIEKANIRLIGSNTAVEYSIHEKTHQIMIKIINSDTKELIKEIPSEKILDLVAKFCEMAGILVDEKV